MTIPAELPVAIVGCGFVADLYLRSRHLHPQLRFCGVYDRDELRRRRFASHHGLRAYDSLESLLRESDASLVLNLTNPRSHYNVSRACLEAGKHVYSEKPLAMRFDEAQALVDLAQQRGLRLSGAPANVLSESAQTLWRAIRDQRVGEVRAVYAELDDGLVHRMPHRAWVSDSGAVWPHVDEFEIGCTLEHAGYYLTWLAACFGPARRVTAFASTQIPDKASDQPLKPNAPDFSVACIEFASGVVARLTCSIIAPHDHQFRVIGDEGILSTSDCWFFRSPVYLQQSMTVRRRRFFLPRRRLPLLGSDLPAVSRKGAASMDFLRGPAELAEALRQDRPCRLSPQFVLHTTELALAIHEAQGGRVYEVQTRFDPIEPMPWAAEGSGGPTPPPAVRSRASASSASAASTRTTTRAPDPVRPVRFGILGVGAVARDFASSLAHAPGAIITASAARRMESAQRFADAAIAAGLGDAVQACADADDLLSRSDVDVVYIATPNHLHHRDALRCLAAGKPVLVEKPFALDAAEAAAVVAAAREWKLFCMEAMWMRFMPLVRRAKQIVDDGRLGRVRVVMADFGYPAVESPDSRLFDPAMGGGALLDRGVYGLSLAQMLLGEPDHVASEASFTARGVDDQCTCVLRFGEALAVVSSSLRVRTSNTAVIFGDDATLMLHEPFYRPHRLTLRGAARPAPAASTQGPVVLAGPRSSGGRMAALRRSPMLRRLARRLQPILEPILRRPILDVNDPVAGAGYQFEAIEAMRCLQQNLTESPLMPLDDTLSVMNLMDRIRGGWAGRGQ
jgi:predicted dehydrogenase